MPERDHPAVLVTLVLLLLIPGIAATYLGGANGPVILAHALGIILIVSGAFLVLGLADTAIIGFPAVAALCSWAAGFLLPSLSAPLAISLAAISTSLLVFLTQGLPKIVTLSASLVIALLLLEALPLPIYSIALDFSELALFSPHVIIGLLLVMLVTRSTGGDIMRLRLGSPMRAADMLLAAPVSLLQLLMAAAGGAVAVLGCILLDRVGWSAALAPDPDGRLLTCLSLAAVMYVGGQGRLSHLLIVSMPLLIVPALAQALVPGMPNPILLVAVTGIFLVAWASRKKERR